MAGWESSRLRSGHDDASMKITQFLFFKLICQHYLAQILEEWFTYVSAGQGEFKLLLKALWTKFKNVSREILELCSVTSARNQDTGSLLASTQSAHEQRCGLLPTVSALSASFIHSRWLPDESVHGLNTWTVVYRQPSLCVILSSFTFDNFYHWIRLIWKTSAYKIFERSLHISWQSESSAETGAMDLTREDGWEQE